MSQQDREVIDQDGFVNLVVEYDGDISRLERFPESTYTIINSLYAVVNIPASYLTIEFIADNGYYILPKLYGLISEASLEASGVQRLRSIPNFDLRGQGVLVGVIDTGVEYTNSIFQYADNTTRIVSIWDQTIQSEEPQQEVEYGRVFSREEINLALADENPLSIVPSMDEVGHGTMIAGIAAGNISPENNFFGIATDSELAVVKLRPANRPLREFYRVSEEVPSYSEVDILMGVIHLLDVAQALQRPMVICIALGTSQGGHDGRGVFDTFVSLSASRVGIAIVIAAGNEGNERSHYFGLVNREAGYDTMELMVADNEPGFVLELWGQTPSIYSIDITSPSGEYIPRISAALNESFRISFVFEITTIDLIYEMVEIQSGDQLIFMRFVNPAPGIWRFNVYERGDLNLGYHMWLPMKRFISEDTFFIRSDLYTTVLNLGNAIVPLVVTAYNDEDDSLFLGASRGYTRTGNVKPEIAAPGVNVIGPVPGGGFQAYTGTSVAAAHTVGIAAMLMEWGYIRGNIPNMSTIELKKFLLRGARRDAGIQYPNRDWGYGILDVFLTFDILRTSFTTT